MFRRARPSLLQSPLMEPTLLGVPVGLYGIPCLVLSFLFIIVWPRQRAPERGVRRFILRWAHALVWLLLGLAAFAAASPGMGLDDAHWLALSSAAVYVVFVVALVTAPRA